MLKNKHKGETGIVIGNGPSLRDVTNAQLDRYPTIGTNRIYLKYHPTYYAATNPLVISQFWQDIERFPSVKFIRANLSRNLGLPLFILTEKIFSREPLQLGVFEGWTITFVALQLAFWLGFDTVLLVGVDHRYSYSGNPNDQSIMDGDDPNHFDPNYFKNSKWNNPDLKNSEKSYQMAREAFDTAGRQVINLTPGSDLKVFQKGKVERWLACS